MVSNPGIENKKHKSIKADPPKNNTLPLHILTITNLYTSFKMNIIYQISPPNQYHQYNGMGD